MQKVLSTRGGTIAVGGLAALLAAVVLLVYLNRYRTSVDEGEESIPVLVANALIPKGTPGTVVGQKDLAGARDTDKNDAKEGAISDPETLKGRVATTDILPGQQLTVADFTASTTDAIATQISDNQRAIAVPLDSATGLIGAIAGGDYVDVVVGFNVVPIDENGVPIAQGGQARPVVKTIMQNVLVLSGATQQDSGIAATNSGSNVTLRVTPEQAADLAFASQNGKIWLILRPRAGAQPVQPNLVTVETVLFGIKPLLVEKTLVREGTGTP